MEFERIRRYLEKQQPEEDEDAKVDQVGLEFFDLFINDGIHMDIIKPGRVLCSFKIPPRLLNKENNTTHGGVLASLMGSAVISDLGRLSTGVTVGFNMSFLNATLPNEHEEIEIEIEAKELLVGKSIVVVMVELRNKATRKVIAQSRHTKIIGKL